MKKILSIDLSSDRLLGVASDMVEEHNYLGALKMLNKNAEQNGNDADAHMLYAEIYDDIGQYEKCVNSWYAFLDTDGESEASEAYEGLAVAYLNLGDERHSAFYYHKLLMDSQDIDSDMRKEIMQSFLSREKNPLKFVYPPELADFTEIISQGIEKMRNGEFDGAVGEFGKVDENNDSYLSARNYIAMCNIIADKSEQAEEECLAVLKKHPDNIQALTTLAAVKTEQKKREESAELARRLLSLTVDNPDDIYKIATVCCENNMHEEAYNLFLKLGDELGYDLTVMYFKAVSAFNCGKYEESFAEFDKLLTVNPWAVTAKYYYGLAREAAEKGEELKLAYFYRLPKEQKEANLKFLSAFEMLSDRDIKKLYADVDISDSIKWCFDERDGNDNEELQFLAAVCAVRAGMDDIIRSILLNAFVSDMLKVRILVLLGDRNKDDRYGVVMCDLYRQVFFREIHVGRNKRKYFIEAYSRLNAHFAALNSAYGEKFAKTAENLYRKLEEKGMLSVASDLDALTAVIYLLSEVKEPKIRRSDLAMFFETSDRKIEKILGAL